MKKIFFFFILFIFNIEVYSSANYIICGWQPGEIFFTGPEESTDCLSGLYYSSDHGESIELRNTHDWSRSYLLSDAATNTIHRLLITMTSKQQLLSFDAGYHWEQMNSWETGSGETYASGVIPGEIYRKSFHPNNHILERSTDYGRNYTQCTMNGYSATLDIGQTALGVNPGEVYIVNRGDLYYSSDYGENFQYITDIGEAFSIDFSRALSFNGVATGEFYICYDYGNKVWRMTDYGAQAELIFFQSNSGYGSLAVSSQPGELYSYSIYPDCCTDSSIMRIYHTTDYFQTWTLHEHVINHTGVQTKNQPIPNNMSLNTYPNPANPDFTIQYQLSQVQPVAFRLFDILGRQVWRENIGVQPPGQYEFIHNSENLPSGTYILKMQINERSQMRKIMVLK